MFEGEGSLTPEQSQLVELYRTLGPAIYRRCLRLLKDPEAARDATQEVFLKLTRDIDRLRDKKTALAWIYRSATHHCFNLLRDRSRHGGKDALFELDESVPADTFPERHLGQQVLARFDSQTQAIAVGALVDGMEHDELAGALGVSRKTVSRKLSRFLANARKFLLRSDG